MTIPEISVIIATRNRADSLEKLLAALQQQITPPVFEVVIADNGSTDKTNFVIKQAATEIPVKSIYVENPGKGRALNAAIKIAGSELIVFTDDDINPSPDWLKQLYSATQRHPEISIFGGQIKVNTDTVPRWILNSSNLMGLLISAHNHGEKDTVYDYGQYPFGPNMAIRRKLLVDIDSPYPEHIGPGTTVPIGDETVFFQQFSRPGDKDRMYIPSALVEHEIESDNITFRKALGRCFLGGRAHAQHAKSPRPSSSKQGTSVMQAILLRVASCHSLRELACISNRFAGYLCGVFLRRFADDHTSSSTIGKQ